MNSRPAAVAAAIDADSLVDLVLEAVRIPSVTPDEMAFARWVQSRLREGPWHDVSLAEPEPGRPNVYARAGEAKDPKRSLLLAGHLDTVHADDWAQEWSGSERADPFAGQIIDGEIWARGVTDQKGGICSVIEAVRAIERAGFRLRGSVTGLFVCDEESGQPGSGVSLGMRTAVGDLYDSSAPMPGFAIYTEPTTGAIYTAQMGFLIADITLVGKSSYFGRPELGTDALKAGHALLFSVGLQRHAGFRRPPPAAGKSVSPGHNRGLGRKHRGARPLRVVAHPKAPAGRRPRRSSGRPSANSRRGGRGARGLVRGDVLRSQRSPGRGAAR